eukprot:1136160-Pelagomonas_calceolata.AAC.6
MHQRRIPQSIRVRARFCTSRACKASHRDLLVVHTMAHMPELHETWQLKLLKSDEPSANWNHVQE